MDDALVLLLASSFVERERPGSTDDEKTMFDAVRALINEIGPQDVGVVGNELVAALTAIRDT